MADSSSKLLSPATPQSRPGPTSTCGSRPIKLGVLLRGHVRHKTLDIALSEWLRYETLGFKVLVHLLLDRPNWLVERVVAKYRSRLFCVCYSPFPLVSPRGERFMEAQNLQLRAFYGHSEVNWFSVADDDRWFDPVSADRELPAALGNPDVDLLYARSLFMWDEPNQHNAARHHDSVAFFRYLPGDRFPLNRIINATERRHDDAIIAGRVGHLETPLLDYGTFDAGERDRVYSAFIAAGKIDPYVQSIRDPPVLIPFSPSRDLWSEYASAP